MAIGTGLALLGGAALGAGASLFGSSKAAKGAQQAAATSAGAQERGAEVQAQSQREALEYLKQREAIPQQLREQALQRLGGIYGIQGKTIPPITYTPSTGGMFSGLRDIAGRKGEVPTQEEPFGQQQLIQQAMESPLYGAMMGGRKAGEETIGRHASMTGGLRSGNVQGAMYDYDTQLQNQALLQSYNQQLQGLQGLAGLPSYAPQIASGMAGVGQTLGQGISGAGQTIAQGQVASGQAWQQGLQGVSDIFGSAAGKWVNYKTPRI
jgi:hypothetical protein